MSKNTTLGGQQSFFVIKNNIGKYDLVAATYKDGEEDCILGALLNMDSNAVTVTTGANGPELSNNGGDITDADTDIIEYTVALDKLESVDGMLRGMKEGSETPIEFAIANAMYIKFAPGTGGAPGGVVFGIVEPWSY